VGVFGEKLRQQREQRGIALDAISNTTKISTRMLRALEDEHFDQLPGGVFNKGFVRAYARQVGLDPEEAVADYLAALRESQVQAQQILPNFRAPAIKPIETAAAEVPQANPPKQSVRNEAPRSSDHGSDPRKDDLRKDARRSDGSQNKPPRSPSLSTMQVPAANPPVERFPKKYPAGNPVQPASESSPQIPWEKLAAALLLVTLALSFWSFRRHHGPTATAQSAATSNRSSAPVSASAAAVPASGSSLALGSAPSAATAPVGTSPTATPTSMSTSAADNAPDSDANPPVAKSKAHASAVKPPPMFTLLIRAEKTTWVSVAADGNPAEQETLIAPAHTSVRATSEIVVKTGNSAGISFLLNGKTVAAQGNEGEARTYIFDATGLRAAPQPQDPAANPQ
jgi:hypothetical protein